MQGRVRCRACGGRVARGTNICPHCGRNPRRFHTRWKPTLLSLLAGFVLGLAIIPFTPQAEVFRRASPLPSPTGTPTPAPLGEPLTAITAVPNVIAAPLTPTATARPPAPTATATSRPLQVEHVVAAGETVGHIARLYNTSIDAILRANNIGDPTRLRIGQVIIVPLPTPTPRPSPTPRPTAAPPRLVSPDDQAEFSGGDALIVLEWEGSLPAAQQFEVRIRYVDRNGETQQRAQRTAETRWTLQAQPLYADMSPSLRAVQWDVVIVDAGGQAVSPPSGSRIFYWR